MTSSRVIAALVLVLPLSGRLADAQSNPRTAMVCAANSVRVTARADSRLWLEGSSNVRDWICKATALDATFEVRTSRRAAPLCTATRRPCFAASLENADPSTGIMMLRYISLPLEVWRAPRRGNARKAERAGCRLPGDSPNSMMACSKQWSSRAFRLFFVRLLPTRCWARFLPLGVPALHTNVLTSDERSALTSRWDDSL